MPLVVHGQTSLSKVLSHAHLGHASRSSVNEESKNSLLSHTGTSAPQLPKQPQTTYSARYSSLPPPLPLFAFSLGRPETGLFEDTCFQAPAVVRQWRSEAEEVEREGVEEGECA
jgi:hypothetical protein